MVKNIKKKLYKVILADKSAPKLAASFCWGIFIGCSPLLGIQSYILAGLSLLLRLNPTVAISAAWIVNNPLTILPIYAANYMFGQWVDQLLHLQLAAHNPWFIDKFNAFLARFMDLTSYVGEEGLCFWCFLLGSFLLPLLVSLAAYYPLKYTFKHLVKYLPDNK